VSPHRPKTSDLFRVIEGRMFAKDANVDAGFVPS
jgi:hypothetical protein